ncbi:MAG: hypothetical protein ACREJC_06955 [Tepidisphaeraceae bacterium]
MRFLVEVGQIAVALLLSGAILTLVGPTYLAVAALVTATCIVVLLDVAHQRSKIIEVPIDLVEVLRIAATAIVFGIVWPAIPLILTWKRGEQSLDGDDGRRS